MKRIAKIIGMSVGLLLIYVCVHYFFSENVVGFRRVVFKQSNSSKVFTHIATKEIFYLIEGNSWTIPDTNFVSYKSFYPNEFGFDLYTNTKADKITLSVYSVVENKLNSSVWTVESWKNKVPQRKEIIQENGREGTETRISFFATYDVFDALGFDDEIWHDHLILNGYEMSFLGW